MPAPRSLQLPLAFFALILFGVSAQAQQMPCMNEIMPLRQAVEKEGMRVKGAIDKKAERSEVCERLKSFAATEAKFVKYIETNASWCAVPPETVKQLKAGHGHTLKMRGQACSAGGPVGGRPGPPPGPGLSEALGTARVPSGDSKADRGTYNTLTGNPLQR